MPAVAYRHPESELQDTPVDTDWEQYSSFVDNFANHLGEDERHKAKQKRRRHKRFHVSLVTAVSTIVTLELVALVWIYALDLRTIRQSNQLDRDIKETSLQIALTQDQLSTQNAAPHLKQWAGQLGFVKAAPHDMDDVTSDAPLPASPKTNKSPE